MRCSRVSPLNPGGCCVLSRKWGFKLNGRIAMASKEEGYLGKRREFSKEQDGETQKRDWLVAAYTMGMSFVV